MALVLSNNSTLSEMVEIFETFDPEEQKVWLRAMKLKKLRADAIRLNKGVNKKKKITVLEIVNEVNQYRKERGYKAYSS